MEKELTAMKVTGTKATAMLTTTKLLATTTTTTTTQGIPTQTLITIKSNQLPPKPS